MIGLGIEVSRGTGGVSVPLTFFDIGYWDLSVLPGTVGDALASNISSPNGANLLSPVSAPVIDDVAIAGKRCAQLAFSALSYLRCDAIATRFTAGLPWTVVLRFRVTSAARDQPLFCAGNSAGGASNYFQVFQTTLGKVKIVSNTVGGGTITRTGTLNLQFDEHVLVVSSDGAALTVVVDGVADTLDNSAIDANALSANRFAIGAVLSSSASSAMDGYVSWFGVAASALSVFNAALLTTQLQAADFVRRKALSPQVMWAGDSITETSVGTLLSAGIRVYELQWSIDNALSLDHVGSRVNGIIADRENVAQGGANILTISGNVTAAFAADPSLAPALVIVMMGTNNLVSPTTAQALADYRTALGAIYTAAVARNPAVKIAVSTITPIQPGTTPADTKWQPFNAGLVAASTGEWDVFEAAHPGVLIRGDNAAALGNAWSAGDYDNGAGGNDTTHPGEVGVQKIGARGILVDYGLFLRSLSPTLKPFYCVIKFPPGGATLYTGTTYTFLIRVSRYPSTVVVRLGAAVLGSAVMNKLVGMFDWTPGAGDLGIQTINAVATDSLDGSIAAAPGASITVAVPVYSPADEGAAIGHWDVSDPTCVTIDGSNNCTAIKNLITGISATEATAPPSYGLSAGPGNAGPAITFVAASSQKLVSAADTTHSAGLAGTNHPFTWVGVIKFTAQNASGFLWSAGPTALANTTQAIGQLATAGGKMRYYRMADSGVSSADIQPSAVPSGWFLLELRHDGTNLKARINGGTETSNAMSTTAFNPTRWGFGMRVDNSPDSPASGSVSEVWDFSDAKSDAAMTRIYNSLVTKWSGLGLATR